MNAILLGAASLGALVAMFTANPSQETKARLETTRAARAVVEQTIEDRGEMKRMTMVDPESGETTNVSVISFAD